MDLSAATEQEHLSDNCWCKPRLLYRLENGTELYVHRYADGIEPPPEVIAASIAELAFGEEEGDTKGMHG